MDKSLEFAPAIRLGAVRPEAALPRYALVSPTPAARAAAHGLLRLRSTGGPAAVVTAMRRATRQAGRPPARVVLEGIGEFRRLPDPRTGRLAGAVALVTGAAQGLGLGIAEALAAEGATVMLGDLNAAAGTAAATALEKRFGPGRAAFAPLDVTRLDSIEAAGAETLRRFGGLDLVIANAGVLKAGGIADLSEADFDLVTAVNYKGFFLTVKATAPLLRLQRRLAPEHPLDIVQINSKSGLEGSNRNFAYAGSKFGGLGLMRSFALELIADGIKVNAICPGNYFDGPLWSDPQKGLFVQYLRTGKVAGAKTLEDVREAYLAKVPMGRGVTPQDLARAILYLREQTYETGQSLTVTGGQIMR